MQINIGADPVSQTPYIGVSFDFHLFWASPKMLRCGTKPLELVKKWVVRLEFKWQDMWLGLYPKIRASEPQLGTWYGLPRSWDVWICLIPMLPIHIGRWIGVKNMVLMEKKEDSHA
jgi:hypothetical protein